MGENAVGTDQAGKLIHAHKTKAACLSGKAAFVFYSQLRTLRL